MLNTRLSNWNIVKHSAADSISRSLRPMYLQAQKKLVTQLPMQKASEQLNYEFRVILQAEFSRRLRVNERYSIRAFARYLQMDSSTLSRLLAGKKQVSEKKISQLCKKMGIQNPLEQNENSDFESVDVDIFTIIADWHHYAILDLVQIKSFKSDTKWIARKLNIENHQAQAAIERLLRVGMLKKENDILLKAQSFYTNYKEGFTAAALKEYQRQIIQKALHAVDNCQQERKDITSITIAADSKKLSEAKDKIKIFRRELCSFLEDGEKDSVYHLAMQLYPVTDLDN